MHTAIIKKIDDTGLYSFVVSLPSGGTREGKLRYNAKTGEARLAYADGQLGNVPCDTAVMDAFLRLTEEV